MSKVFVFGLAPLLTLISGCSRESSSANDVDIAGAAETARDSVENYAALPRSAQPRATPVAPAPMPSSMATPAPEPSATATTESEEDTNGAAAAAAVVTRYYGLIEDGRYVQAWRLWDQDGEASGMDRSAFAASFAKYATYRAEVGPPGDIEAGAGQRYVTLPVRIAGRLKDGGRPFAMEGPVTLHRTGDIDGATAEQRSWRISASGVRPRPGNISSAEPSTPPNNAR